MKTNNLLDQFIQKLDTAAWNKMEVEERLKLLQEYENIIAASENRPALQIRVVPDDKLKEYEKAGILHGYFNGEAIYINPKYLTSRMKLLGVSPFTLPAALEVITHEGRHAWQKYVVDHPELGIVDRKTRLAIQMNRCVYISGKQTYGAYAGQLIEVDARRFAMHKMAYICQKLKERDGRIDGQFQSTLRKELQTEIRVASEIRKIFTEDTIRQFEDNARIAMKKFCPGVDFKEASIYGEAVDVLRSGNALGFAVKPPIRALEVRATVIKDGKTEKNTKPIIDGKKSTGKKFI